MSAFENKFHFSEDNILNLESEDEDCENNNQIQKESLSPSKPDILPMTMKIYEMNLMLALRGTQFWHLEKILHKLRKSKIRLNQIGNSKERLRHFLMQRSSTKQITSGLFHFVDEDSISIWWYAFSVRGKRNQIGIR